MRERILKNIRLFLLRAGGNNYMPQSDVQIALSHKLHF